MGFDSLTLTKFYHLITIIMKETIKKVKDFAREIYAHDTVPSTGGYIIIATEGPEDGILAGVTGKGSELVKLIGMAMLQDPTLEEIIKEAIYINATIPDSLKELARKTHTTEEKRLHDDGTEFKPDSKPEGDAELNTAEE